MPYALCSQPYFLQIATYSEELQTIAPQMGMGAMTWEEANIQATSKALTSAPR